MRIQNVPLKKLEESHPEVLPGGQWRPLGCISRHRVAIIIPYRDREEHLRIFLNHMHPFLQKQQLDYGIYIVEQVSNTQNVGCCRRRRHHLTNNLQLRVQSRIVVYSEFVLKVGNSGHISLFLVADMLTTALPLDGYMTIFNSHTHQR